MASWPERWHQGHPILRLLLPLSWLFAWLVARRRRAYATGKKSVWRSPVPVIVVGNISVGGTGKTPLTQALVAHLQAAGWQPGIISRGYGGRTTYPCEVSDYATPAEVGDEPLLLARACGVPVVVDPNRSRGAAHLLARHPECSVLISDDGLQHYALARDIEIVVIDGKRGLGSGWLLPAGPLREPPARLREVDLIVLNGSWHLPSAKPPQAHIMVLEPQPWRPVNRDEPQGTPPAQGPVHAVAGIGHPPRFFELLASLGYGPEPHAFPDHYAYRAQDLQFQPAWPVVMTEKDAVKCAQIAPPNSWYVPVQAALPEAFWQALAKRLTAWAAANKTLN
ncbi:lipid-A-disaccharide kinase [Paraperlucidibaca baekdonensis]|uniref:Tetraacyldisaccharide 4'-kinase n=1 Tax=Paraperlucidibaca baekdonensis TaxID=748120 RepID=A0A3E0H7X2_9GAMM|nr:tetraacyldisaccharide 4'-kinase [Paraperlucidibaca baekdonensis]REH38906.1 lipid-A-disaccharide kinase [Paraperlucidibaca baekdonensis]